MIEAVALTPSELTIAVFTVFLAGIVRGFSGFALSALIMASLVLILPPVHLIPICTLLELSASAMLVRGGYADADKKLVLGLQSGALIGVPVGLYMTTTLDPVTSRTLALGLILVLATLQLARVRLPADGAMATTFVTGIISGFATGIASIGGMVIALYTLARSMPAKAVRGSLILVILIGGSLSVIYQTAFGMMNGTAALRALVLVLPTLAGVYLGRAMFTPKYESYYRPFCLTLLMGLALLGLVRSAL
jgi:hypothetical protein